MGRAFCRKKQDEEQTRGDSTGKRVHVEQEAQPRDPADHRDPLYSCNWTPGSPHNKLIFICPNMVRFLVFAINLSYRCF